MTRCRWSMRITIAAAVFIMAPLAFAQTSCDAMDPCAAKACRLDAQMAQAKANGNVHAQGRLERARAEVVHCSDDGLKQKRKVALEQAQQRIDQRAAELKKAQTGGTPTEVKKAQRKLDSARKAYAEIEKSPL
jgi:hypothetical protein